MPQTKQYRIVHYLNQFFGGIGAEDKARVGFSVKEGSVGPGKLLERNLEGRAVVVATVICGDDFIAENLESVSDEILGLAASHRPDIFLAGPAFGAGRYGLACGHLCKLIQDKLGIPAVTGMHHENPAVNIYRANVHIVSTQESALDMESTVNSMAKLAIKMASGEPLGPAKTEGYIPRGIRDNVLVEKNGAERAVEMLLNKINGLPYDSEIPLTDFGKVTPAEPVRDLKSAKIALVTTGGLVPKGDPDKIERGRTTRWLKYSIAGLNDLTSQTHEAIHAGYDTRLVGEDPDRLLPLDEMRELGKEGAYGSLYDWYYVVSGQGAHVANAIKIGSSIGEELLQAGVQGVILTST